MDPDIEQIDLAALTAVLQRVFQAAPPAGYLTGRTAIRDALAAHLACSDALAEQLVDTLIARAFLCYEGDPARVEASDAPWTLGSP